MAAYVRQGNRIIVRQGLDCDWPLDRSLLIHEAVHSIQAARGVDCRATDCGGEAYAVQNRYLREAGAREINWQGVKP
jgi:hypothetical protein